MGKYKLIGDHPEDLEGGRVAAPGDIIDLSDEETESPANKSLIDDGRLVLVPEAKTAPKAKEGGKA